MLGTFVGFLGFVCAVYWWVLAKQFRKYCKGEESMPVVLFVIYCVLSIIVWGFILLVVFSALPEFLPRHYNHKLSNAPEILFGIVLVIIVAFVVIQCRLYVMTPKKRKRQNSDVGSYLKDKAMQPLKSPESFTEVFSFVEFVKTNGPTVGLVSHTNSSNGKEFHTLEIKDDSGKTVSVRFHSSLGELNSKELKERKHNLMVGKRISDQRWYLYDKNFEDNSGWEEVDLGISLDDNDKIQKMTEIEPELPSKTEKSVSWLNDINWPLVIIVVLMIGLVIGAIIMMSV